jgi:hypothetical protein
VICGWEVQYARLLLFVSKIKSEMILWSTAGSKHLGSLMPLETILLLGFITNLNSLINEQGKAFALFQKKRIPF